jgi:hypothetical protein
MCASFKRSSFTSTGLLLPWWTTMKRALCPQRTAILLMS